MPERKGEAALKTLTPQSGSVNDPTAAPGGRLERGRVLYCVHWRKNFREASALAVEEAAD